MKEPISLKVSILQMLTFKFETIKMDDHDSFDGFHAKLIDTVILTLILVNPSLTLKSKNFKISSTEI